MKKNKLGRPKKPGRPKKEPAFCMDDNKERLLRYAISLMTGRAITLTEAVKEIKDALR